MGNVQIYSTGLRGLSFSIAELTLVAAWAEAQGLQMGSGWIMDPRRKNTRRS